MLEHSAHDINPEETDESDGDEGEDDEHVQDVKSQAADACPDEDEELQKGYVYQAGDEYLERSKMPSNVSGYRGVTRSQGGKWVAQKGHQKKHQHQKESSRYLAFFYDSAIDAARARRDFMANPSTAPAQPLPEEDDESDEDGDDDDDDDDEASVPPLPGDDKLERSKLATSTSGNSPQTYTFCLHD